jgi:hypothetical protein
VTDAGGRFAFAARKEWDWLTFGEAPLPFTVVVACDADRRIAAAPMQEPVVLSLGDERTADAALDGVHAGRGWAARNCLDR